MQGVRSIHDIDVLYFDGCPNHKLASVTYADGLAVLSVNAGAAPTRNELAAIIEEAGYRLK